MWKMDETHLLTIESVHQIDDDLLVYPTLPADKYSLGDVHKVKIIKPDNQVVEFDVEFSVPLTRPPSWEYWLRIPETQKDEVPVGSQVWVYKALAEISRQTG